VSQTTLDSPQEAADLDVAGWDLDTDGLVVFLLGGVGVAVGLVVDVACDILGKAVTGFTELLAVAVNLIRVVAVDTLASVCLKVVGGPGLGGVDWSGDTFDWVFVEADHSLLLG
jgi:hypothetical protein